MKLFTAFVLFLAAHTASAAVPSWLRVVDFDGQVIDVPGYAIERIEVCPTRGDADIYSQNEGAGVARIKTAWGELALTYAFKFYNQGAVTGNPNTTGDQVVLIEATDALFSAGFESCQEYAP